MATVHPNAAASPNAVVVLRGGGTASAALKLFCFPPAAGGASVFRKWPFALPPEIALCAIQMPGRESRIRESPVVHMEDLVEQISCEIASLLNKPFGFYGHSMGALIAFEVAHAVRKRTGLSPVHFIVSAARPPQARQMLRQLHLLPGQEFVREVERYGLLPAHVLKCDELIELLGPLLRADLRLCDEYRYVHRPPFQCPFTVIGCLDDPWVPPAELVSWQAHTVGPFARIMVGGGHQLGDDSAASFLSIIRSRLSLDGMRKGARW